MKMKISDLESYIIFNDKEFLKTINLVYDDFVKNKKLVKQIEESTDFDRVIESGNTKISARDIVNTVKHIKTNKNKPIVNNKFKTVMRLLGNLGILGILTFVKYDFPWPVLAAIVLALVINSDIITTSINSIGKGLFNTASKLFDNDIRIAFAKFKGDKTDYILSFDISDFEWELNYTGLKGWIKRPDNYTLDEILENTYIRKFLKSCYNSASEFYKNKNLPIIFEMILENKNINKKYKKIFKSLLINKDLILNNIDNTNDIEIVFKESFKSFYHRSNDI